MPSISLGSFLADDELTLDDIASKAFPDGKSYEISPLSGEDWLRLQKIVAKAGPNTADYDADDAKALADFCKNEAGEDIPMAEKLIGSEAMAEMLADGVSGSRLNRIQLHLTLYYGYGPEVAEGLVASAGKAVAQPNRADRRAAAKKVSPAKPRKTAAKKAPAKPRSSARAAG